jgi:hypothetical protein
MSQCAEKLWHEDIQFHSVRIKYDCEHSLFQAWLVQEKMVGLHLLFGEVFAMLPRYESYTQCKVDNN